MIGKNLKEKEKKARMKSRVSTLSDLSHYLAQKSIKKKKISLEGGIIYKIPVLNTGDVSECGP